MNMINFNIFVAHSSSCFVLFREQAVSVIAMEIAMTAPGTLPAEEQQENVPVAGPSNAQEAEDASML